jgi:hypothetical protein
LNTKSKLAVYTKSQTQSLLHSRSHQNEQHQVALTKLPYTKSIVMAPRIKSSEELARIIRNRWNLSNAAAALRPDQRPAGNVLTWEPEILSTLAAVADRHASHLAGVQSQLRRIIQQRKRTNKSAEGRSSRVRITDMKKLCAHFGIDKELVQSSFDTSVTQANLAAREAAHTPLLPPLHEGEEEEKTQWASPKGSVAQRLAEWRAISPVPIDTPSTIIEAEPTRKRRRTGSDEGEEDGQQEEDRASKRRIIDVRGFDDTGFLSGIEEYLDIEPLARETPERMEMAGKRANPAWMGPAFELNAGANTQGVARGTPVPVQFPRQNGAVNAPRSQEIGGPQPAEERSGQDVSTAAQEAPSENASQLNVQESTQQPNNTQEVHPNDSASQVGPKNLSQAPSNISIAQRFPIPDWLSAGDQRRFVQKLIENEQARAAREAAASRERITGLEYQLMVLEAQAKRSEELRKGGE